MEIRRDILMDQKERVALNDLEEQDNFEAEQYMKTELDAKAMRRGRPKKTHGELLSEASRMLREKAPAHPARGGQGEGFPGRSHRQRGV